MSPKVVFFLRVVLAYLDISDVGKLLELSLCVVDDAKHQDAGFRDCWTCHIVCGKG